MHGSGLPQRHLHKALFYEYLIPLIEANIGDKVSVIAVGTGQALRLAENGDADILVVHAPEKEKAINAYKIKGKQVFIANAKHPNNN